MGGCYSAKSCDDFIGTSFYEKREDYGPVNLYYQSSPKPESSGTGLRRKIQNDRYRAEYDM